MKNLDKMVAMSLLGLTVGNYAARAASDGTVDSFQKISDTAGTFDGILDDSDRFGTSVATLGDLDGDGVTDMAVGASLDDDGGINRGAVWILFLNADGTVKSEQKISDTMGGFNGVLEDGDRFSERHMANVGDLDGDGVTDLAVGNYLDNDGGFSKGAVWILFLNADGTVKAEQKISDTTGGFNGNIDSDDNFGTSVTSLSDLDGDGIADLAVGARLDDDGGEDKGAVWILFLNADGTVKAEQKISDTTGGFNGNLDDRDRFGKAVTNMGDLDGDGVTDLAVGATLDDDGGTDRGAVWILFLNADGTVKAEQKISDTAGGFNGGLQDSDSFGISVTDLGDFNGDSVTDLVVCAQYDDDGGTDRGAVWILFLTKMALDTTAPTDPPAIASTTHAPSTWSSLDRVEVQWSGATDTGGSGLAGYSVFFDNSASALPDDSVDVDHSSDPHATISGALADGNSHYFHLRTCDHAGNCTSTVHLGPYWIDTTPPSGPTYVQSSSHVVGHPSNDDTIDVTWDEATDPLSGVAASAYAFNNSATWTCPFNNRATRRWDQVNELEATASGVTSTPLADGSWYFHICAVDNVGNSAAVATAGPFVIDTASPTVTLVTTVADTGDGELSADESIRSSITQAYVSFSEDVNNATNPASYLLIGPGSDGDFDTVSCAGGSSGDDVYSIDQALYDTLTARLKVNGGVPLARGRYRLMVCGTTSIVDLAGNAFDGNGDGTGGDDFVLSFQVTESNLLLNPNFDDDLSSWEPSSPTEIRHSSEDTDGAPTSGSARITSVSETGPNLWLSQCVNLSNEYGGYLAGGRARVVSGLSTEPQVITLADFYDGADCAGNLIHWVSSPNLVGDTAGVWEGFQRSMATPAGAVSARVSFAVAATSSPAFEAYLDNVFMFGVLFADGFESGDTSAWSATQASKRW